MARRQEIGWRVAIALCAVIAASGLAFVLSPQPGAAVIAWLFDAGAARASAALERHQPGGVESLRDLPGPPRWPGLAMDVHRPATPAPQVGRPLLVWVHGGAWVSGGKGDVANYLRIVAARADVVAVALDYTLAPDATHPTQLLQVHDGLVQALAQAPAWGADPQRVVLAGDSAGAQLAAQLAAALSTPGYAAQLGLEPRVNLAALRGVALFCGPYDLLALRYDGTLGPALRTVLWAFTGQRGVEDNPSAALASVQHHVSARFPPAFITVGNADPLLPQSLALERRLIALGVAVETLYFPEAREPALGHEYQFNLDDAAGGLALQRLADFVRSRAAR